MSVSGSYKDILYAQRGRHADMAAITQENWCFQCISFLKHVVCVITAEYIIILIAHMERQHTKGHRCGFSLAYNKEMTVHEAS